jgi:hypothetical protein
MGARNQLTSASCNGSLGIAAVREVLAQSGPAFFVTRVVRLAGNLVRGDIRTTRVSRRPAAPALRIGSWNRSGCRPTAPPPGQANGLVV